MASVRTATKWHTVLSLNNWYWQLSCPATCIPCSLATLKTGSQIFQASIYQPSLIILVHGTSAVRYCSKLTLLCANMYQKAAPLVMILNMGEGIFQAPTPGREPALATILLNSYCNTLPVFDNLILEKGN